MKAALFVLLLTLPVCAQSDPLRLSEPVATTDSTETFGTTLDTSLPAVSLAALINEPQRHLDTAFLLETRVAKVCQKKGCFFIAQSDDHIMRVSFRDYDFFIPTDSAQKIVTLTGQLVQKSVSKEKAAHYARDLNAPESNIKQGVVYEIVADSIRLPLRGQTTR